MTDWLWLVLVAMSGAGLVGGVLLVRASDQRARDARREVVTLGFPRGLSAERTLAVVRTVIGLAPTVGSLKGRDSVALEIVGSGAAITHRLRLPATSSAYLVAQLRVAVPGIAVEELADFTPERWRTAVELRRRMTDADLAIGDVAAIGRTTWRQQPPYAGEKWWCGSWSWAAVCRSVRRSTGQWPSEC